MQQRQNPTDLSSISSSAYRNKVTEHDDDDLQRTYQPSYSDSTRKPIYSGSQSSHRVASSQHESESRRVGSVAPVYVGSSHVSSGNALHSSSQQSASEGRTAVPIGQYVNIAVRPGQSTVIPVRVVNPIAIPAEHQQYYSRHSENDKQVTRVGGSSPTTTTYHLSYNPSRNYVATDKVSSSTAEEERLRISGGNVQQPEKLRNRVDDSDTQQRVSGVTVSYPSNGGSSRYASSGPTQSRVAPSYTDSVSSSSSSRRTEEERNERRFTPQSPSHVSTVRDGSSSHGTGTGSQSVYYVAAPSTRIQSQSQIGSQSQQQGRGGGFTYYYPSSGSSTGSQLNSASSSDKLATRFGSGVLSSNSDDLHSYMSESEKRARLLQQQQSSQSSSNIAIANLDGNRRHGSATRVYSGNNDDLSSYMSEAERLARLQQQQISGSSSNIALSNLDANRRTVQTASSLDQNAANFVHGSSSNLASRNSEFDSANSGTGAGGFTRVKSWNRQSNWASGSEYGPDGKPKTYSHLSTAEAEKHNINGQEAGYKAATTTLENDGKVSTYSIHTP
jgi:hypothetical protein